MTALCCQASRPEIEINGEFSFLVDKDDVSGSGDVEQADKRISMPGMET